MHTTQTLDIIIPRRGINDDGKGKKYALHRLITASDADVIWMQDDDIIPAKVSHEEVLKTLGNADMLILPLRMESESPHPNVLERLQIAEYAAIQELTIQSAQKGHAVMCSGANLVVKRQAWCEAWSELHPEIPSGDDMFLLESMKRHHRRITVADGKQWEAVVRPHKNVKDLFKQRMRWAGKAPHYTDPDIRCMGIWVVVMNLLQILFPPIIVIKFPFEYRLIKKRDPKVSLPIAMLLEVCYPVYMFICLIGGRIRNQW